MKILGFLLVQILFLLPVYAHATECGDAGVMMEYKLAPDSELRKRDKIILTGNIETPGSGYKYQIKIEKLAEDKTLYAYLFLYEGDLDLVKTAAITPLEIDSSIEVPTGVKRVFLKVVKDFNWGNTMFSGIVDPNKPSCLDNQAVSP